MKPEEQEGPVLSWKETCPTCGAPVRRDDHVLVYLNTVRCIGCPKYPFDGPTTFSRFEVKL